jgi:hypothetical protein
VALPGVSLVAVTVTDEVPAVVGVPLMTPLAASMDNPAGSPVADQVNEPVPPVAVIPRLTAVPTVLIWLPGLLTVTAVAALPAVNAAYGATAAAWADPPSAVDESKTATEPINKPRLLRMLFPHGTSISQMSGDCQTTSQDSDSDHREQGVGRNIDKLA